ncbi:MAG: biotin/lipoyl-containing protein [Candidatus Promineifilaceae bacterium]
MKQKFLIGTTEYELDTTRRGDQILIEIEGVQHKLRLISAENNTLLLEHNGRLLRVAGSRKGDNRQVWVNGQTVSYRKVSENSAENEAPIGSLSASIPAVVAEVLVKVGDTVSAGDKLILLESMKMIIPIHAPADGTISTISCEVGQSVQPGVPLLHVES